MIKILIGIPCIDRDYKYLNNLFNFINSNINNRYKLDIIIATRKCDKNTIEFAKKCKLIKCDNYSIEGRHNVKNIAIKRNKIIKYASNNNYDYLLFLDADILPYHGFIDDLLNLKSDVAVGLYPVRWYNNKSICFTISDNKYCIKELSELNTDDRIIIAGFGCCLIEKKLFNIEVKQLKYENNDFYLDGEDFGWFKDIYEKGYMVKNLTKNITHLSI